jgi:hypothetical protein
MTGEDKTRSDLLATTRNSFREFADNYARMERGLDRYRKAQAAAREAGLSETEIAAELSNVIGNDIGRQRALASLSRVLTENS